MALPLSPDLFSACGTVYPPMRVGGKWHTRIIICLMDGPRRFSELRVPMHEVSAKALTESLRAMERDGFVSRTVISEVPRHVEYSLTGLGRTLIPSVDAMCEWTREFTNSVKDARRRFEEIELAH